MKKLILIIIAGGLGFGCAYGLLRQTLKQQQDAFAGQQAEWLSEKSDFEAAIASARGRTVILPGATKVVEVEVAVAKKISPAEILEQLKKAKYAADQPRSSRRIVHQFENLFECGTAALPAIRDFLTNNVELDFDITLFSKGSRNGKIPTEFVMPPSLRLGLFEVLKNIGGADAEKILVDTLTTAGRGVEVAYLAQVLEEMSPGRYRDVALAAARELLAHPVANATDKGDRNYLFATLGMFGDASFAAQAQAQLIQPDGKVDAAALKYLQQTQPEKTLALAIQSYQDPRVTDPQAKERLAQIALDTAGVDPLADAFFQAVLGDTSLPSENRNNLAQDFADRGYSNLKDPTPRDYQMMQNRLAKLEHIRGEVTDPVVIGGIVEAQKDLNKFIRNYAARHPSP